MDYQTTLARHLLQIKAIKLSPQKPFTWASGLKSPIYCDNRLALSQPVVRRLIRDGFAHLAQRYPDTEGIAGVATAGIAHGVLLADYLELPFIYVRSKAKAHGRQNLIEGQLVEGNSYLVVEDLISTGGSSLQAVRAVKEAGAKVSATVAIFTYGFERAVKAFDEENCPLATLSNFDILLQVAKETGYINQEELALLEEWQLNPQAWSDARV